MPLELKTGLAQYIHEECAEHPTLRADVQAGAEGMDKHLVSTFPLLQAKGLIATS